MMAVCTENLIRIDWLAESLNVSAQRSGSGQIVAVARIARLDRSIKFGQISDLQPL